MKRMLWIVLLSAVLLFTTGFKLVQGGDTTMQSGETYEGSMLLMGGNYIVEEGATIDGNVWIIGGNIELGGEITGDVHLYGGNLSLVGGSIGGELNDQRTEASGGDGFNVIDVGPAPCACCCGVPLLLVGLLVFWLVRRGRKKRRTETPAASAGPEGA